MYYMIVSYIKFNAHDLTLHPGQKQVEEQEEKENLDLFWPLCHFSNYLPSPHNLA